jgi:trans-aconitate methyltransferase
MLTQQLLAVPNYFPTPAPLIERLLSKVIIRPGDTILEPSAGEGDIADYIRSCYPHNDLRVVEIEPALVRILKSKGFHGVQGDFLRYRQGADVIIGNPPFRNNFQDIDHFYHAWDILNPGGRMAMILHGYSGFPLYNTGKPERFGQFLTAIGAQKEKNPSGSFSTAKRRTHTDTCIVWATKPSSEKS